MQIEEGLFVKASNRLTELKDIKPLTPNTEEHYMVEKLHENWEKLKDERQMEYIRSFNKNDEFHKSCHEGIKFY